MKSARVEHFRAGEVTVGVVGLGYVGLPLSVEIARSSAQLPDLFPSIE